MGGSRFTVHGLRFAVCGLRLAVCGWPLAVGYVFARLRFWSRAQVAKWDLWDAWDLWEQQLQSANCKLQTPNGQPPTPKKQGRSGVPPERPAFPVWLRCLRVIPALARYVRWDLRTEWIGGCPVPY